MNPQNDFGLGNIDGSNALDINVNNVDDNIIPFPNGNQSAKNNSSNNNVPAGDEGNGAPKSLDMAGKKVNEKGEVEDSSTKKAVKAIGRGAAAYFSGGESLKYDQQVTNNRIGDKVIGVVSDGLEKVPGVETLAEGLDELNVSDTANAAMDTVGSAMNGDIAGAVESGVKIVKEAKKTRKAIFKKLLILFLPIILFIVLFIVILSPMLGGFIDLTNKGATNNNSSGNTSTGSKPGPSDDGNYVDKETISNMDIQITEAQIEYLKSTIPHWESLNTFQKNAIMASYSMIGKVDYVWGGKPSAAGISGVGKGLDCSGFVSWTIWTASGNSFIQSTEQLAKNLGFNGLKRIEKSDILPGDIVIVRRPDNSGHTLIYAGNDQYIHAPGSGQKVKMSSYTLKEDNEIYYARYTG